MAISGVYIPAELKKKKFFFARLYDFSCVPSPLTQEEKALSVRNLKWVEVMIV